MSTIGVAIISVVTTQNQFSTGFNCIVIELVNFRVNIRTAQSRACQIEALCAKTDEECLPVGLPAKIYCSRSSVMYITVKIFFYSFGKKTDYS